MKRLLFLFVFFFLVVVNVFAQDTGFISYGTSNATAIVSLSTYNSLTAYKVDGTIQIAYPNTGDVPYFRMRKAYTSQTVSAQTIVKVRIASPTPSLKMKMGFGLFNAAGNEGTSGLVEISNNGTVADYQVNVLALSGFTMEQAKLSFSLAPGQPAGNFTIYILGIWVVNNGTDVPLDIPGGSGVVTIPGVPILGIPADGTTITALPYQFNWNSVPGATSYTFQLDTDQVFGSPITIDQTITAVSYSVSTIANGTYYWRVRANNSAGSSAFTSPRTVIVNISTVTQDPPTITSPVNGATNISLNGQVVVFTLPSNASGCKLELKEKVSGELVKNEIIQSPFILNNLKPTTQYSFRLGAVYTNTMAWTAEYLFTTVGNSTVSPPMPLSPTNNTIGLAIPVGLVASSVQNAVSYEFQMSRTENFSSLEYAATQPTSYVNIHILYWNTKYYWRVRAVTTATTSDWSQVWNFTTGTTTGVDNQNNIPTKFELMQNYPNPFNPATSIKYSVSSIQYVRITVFDILGKEVAVLVNEEKPVGRYEVRFDGSILSSGIYIYKFQAGNFSATKKMILMK